MTQLLMICVDVNNILYYTHDTLHTCKHNITIPLWITPLVSIPPFYSIKQGFCGTYIWEIYRIKNSYHSDTAGSKIKNKHLNIYSITPAMAIDWGCMRYWFSLFFLNIAKNPPYRIMDFWFGIWGYATEKKHDSIREICFDNHCNLPSLDWIL